MGARNRVVVPARQATQVGGIGSLESILGLLKSLQIQALKPISSYKNSQGGNSCFSQRLQLQMNIQFATCFDTKEALIAPNLSSKL